MNERAGILRVVEPPGAAGVLDDRSDDELALLARAGHRLAFDALVRRHQRRALDVALKYLGDPALARDAAQEAFIELYRYLPRYQARGTFVPFWNRLLMNRCRMAARSRRFRLVSSERLAAQPIAPRALADDELIRQERQRDVQRAVLSLSDKLRAVVTLRYAAELSLQEIAEVLELPVGTVKSRLFAGLEQMRIKLEGDGP